MSLFIRWCPPFQLQQAASRGWGRTSARLGCATVSTRSAALNAPWQADSLPKHWVVKGLKWGCQLRLVPELGLSKWDMEAKTPEGKDARKQRRQKGKGKGEVLSGSAGSGGHGRRRVAALQRHCAGAALCGGRGAGLLGRPGARARIGSFMEATGWSVSRMSVRFRCSAAPGVLITSQLPSRGVLEEARTPNMDFRLGCRKAASAFEPQQGCSFIQLVKGCAFSFDSLEGLQTKTPILRSCRGFGLLGIQRSLGYEPWL